MNFLIDINFHFGGEYFANSSTGFVIDFLKILIPLIGGFLLSRWYEWWLKKRKQLKAKDDLINEINLLKEPIKLQREAINKFLDHLKEDSKYTTPNFSTPALLQIERIKLLERNLIVDYLEKYFRNRQKALERTNRIFASLGVIQAEYLAIERSFYEYKERGNILFDNWSDGMDQLVLLYTEFCAIDLRKNIDPANDSFLSILNPYFERLLADKDRDIFDVNKYFNVELTKQLGAMLIDERTSHFRPFIYTCNKSLRDLKELRREMIFRFGHHSETFRLHFEKLEERIKDIQ